MTQFRWIAISALTLVAATAAGSAADRGSREADDVAQLAARIDAHIESAWRDHGVTPAPVADDAEFLRRVSLDLAGRIPSVWQVRAFLDDDRAEKRRRVVERLLESPTFLSHFAVKRRKALVPDEGGDFQLRFQLSSFDLWLRQRMIEDGSWGWDDLVQELLTVSLNGNPASGAGVFYLAHEKPEDLAAATSRRFLGLRLECAQCHDHPFSDWKQDEFWSLAAFFAGIENGQDRQAEDSASLRTIRIPDSDTLAEPRFLDGRAPDFDRAPNPRHVLAQWITSAQNPYFARATANWVWAELFGVGIVDPPDDLDVANPPSHPRLLDELAAELAVHDFDVRFLIRAITASKAYQLTSRRTGASQDNARLFARRIVRGLSAGQLYDSLVQATGHYDPWSFRTREREFDSPRLRFRQQFDDRAQRPAEAQTTILQALAMMNGDLTAMAADADRCATLEAVLDAPFFTDAERIETLFLATLSRRPELGELARMTGYVERAEPPQNHVDARSAAFADIFWALINSSEFRSNH